MAVFVFCEMDNRLLESCRELLRFAHIRTLTEKASSVKYIYPDLKAHKRILPKEDLLDRAGRVELAANEFRITQAEDKLRRENVKGESAAINTHRDVGHAVRTTIQKLGGKLLEDLPPEPSIKRLSAKSRATAAMSGQTQSLALPEAHGPRTTVED